MTKIYFLILLSLFLFSCRNIFTTNVFSDFKTNPGEMSSEQIYDFLESTPLNKISPEDLLSAEGTLAASRVKPSADELSKNSQLKEKYLKETKILLEINKEQADISGLISSALTAEGDQGNSLVSSILSDSDRLANIAQASSYAVDAFEADPESLESSDLIIGSVGLLGDILSDETSTNKLKSLDNLETSTLTNAGFNTEEIKKIQTADSMIDLAKSGLDESMSSLFEGLPF